MTKRPRTKRPGTRFVLLDEERCRLLRAESTKRGTPHVEEVGTLDNITPGPMLGRPQALGGMTGHSYASPHHRQREHIRRFAKHILEWLQKKHMEEPFLRLPVFGTPRMVGELRRNATGALATVLELKEINLSRLNAAELAQHAEISGLIESTQT